MASPILDGCTLSATLDARGPWSALTFAYRPALCDAVDLYLEEARSGPKRKTAAVLDLLGKHVVGWDVPDKDGNAAPVTRAMLAKLPHPYREEMLNFVTGYATSEQQETQEKNSP